MVDHHGEPLRLLLVDDSVAGYTDLVYAATTCAEGGSWQVAVRASGGVVVDLLGEVPTRVVTVSGEPPPDTDREDAGPATSWQGTARWLAQQACLVSTGTGAELASDEPMDRDTSIVRELDELVMVRYQLAATLSAALRMVSQGVAAAFPDPTASTAVAALEAVTGRSAYHRWLTGSRAADSEAPLRQVFAAAQVYDATIVAALLDARRHDHPTVAVIRSCVAAVQASLAAIATARARVEERRARHAAAGFNSWIPSRGEYRLANYRLLMSAAIAQPNDRDTDESRTLLRGIALSGVGATGTSFPVHLASALLLLPEADAEAASRAATALPRWLTAHTSLGRPAPALWASHAAGWTSPLPAISISNRADVLDPFVGEGVDRPMAIRVPSGPPFTIVPATPPTTRPGRAIQYSPWRGFRHASKPDRLWLPATIERDELTVVGDFQSPVPPAVDPVPVQQPEPQWLLLGRMPARAGLERVVDLIVRIAKNTDALPEAEAAPLRNLALGPNGATVTITLSVGQGLIRQPGFVM